MHDERPQRTLLALLFEASGNSQAEEVKKFNLEAANDSTLSVRTFRRWLTGEVKTRPRPAQCQAALARWGYSMDDLLAPPRPGTLVALQAKALVGGQSGAAADGTSRMTLERRIEMAAQRASRFTQQAEAAGIGPETLDDLRDGVRAVATAYLREPVGTLLGPLLEVQDAVFNHLEARQRPAAAAELYLLAGVVSALLAKGSHDLGRPRDAMTQARAAYVCADNAGHARLRAWARGLQSLVAYWNGRIGDAARYAQLGAVELGDGRGSVSSWLPALEARAWALAGNPSSAAAAIERAEAARELYETDDLDEIGGLFSFGRAKQHYYAAGALVRVPESAARAAQEASTALELYTSEPAEHSYSDIAGAHAELSLARVLAGELDGAADALAPVLDLPPERRIVGIIESTRRVHTALRAPGVNVSPTAHGIRGAIESFTRVPAAETR